MRDTVQPLWPFYTAGTRLQYPNERDWENQSGINGTGIMTDEGMYRPCDRVRHQLSLWCARAMYVLTLTMTLKMRKRMIDETGAKVEAKMMESLTQYAQPMSSRTTQGTRLPRVPRSLTRFIVTERRASVRKMRKSGCCRGEMK